MKYVVMKVATLVFLIGLFFSGIGIWKIFQERNVSRLPVPMTIDKVSVPHDGLIYASIRGGELDAGNIYEYILSAKKTETKLLSYYYVPVRKTGGGKVVYLLKLALKPTSGQIAAEANYKGLLSDISELPRELQDAYKTKFPWQNYYVLDSTYEPKTIMEKFADLKVFFMLLVGGLLIRVVVGKKRAKGVR